MNSDCANVSHCPHCGQPVIHQMYHRCGSKTPPALPPLQDAATPSSPYPLCSSCASRDWAIACGMRSPYYHRPLVAEEDAA